METSKIKLNSVQQCYIAHNLSNLMKLKKTTESKVAQELNIPVMTIRRLLSGETTDPRVYTLKTIADYFNVTIDVLLGESELVSQGLLNSSKPVFVPIFDWDTARNKNNINLNQWEEWVPVTIRNDQISSHSFALESRPSMYPRFQQGTIFIFDPELTPSDGDLVLINLINNNELTLRELLIDPPVWQLHPVNPDLPILEFIKEEHEIIGVVFLTLFYNRRMRPSGGKQ